MSKILDLSVYTNDTFDITLPNGKETIKVKKPTQAIVIEMMGLSEAQKKNESSVIDKLITLTANILSHNTDNRTFTADWVKNELDFTMISAIIKGYSAFTEELQSNPF